MNTPLLKIGIINGPNLNLLGKRETSVYGVSTFESFYDTLKTKYQHLSFSYFQSNVEGELITCVQEFGFTLDGIILNPGGYTHTSVALADALAAVPAPAIEVHISNIYARENFRMHSYTAAKCAGVIGGLGLFSYELAVLALMNVIKK